MKGLECVLEVLPVQVDFLALAVLVNLRISFRHFCHEVGEHVGAVGIPRSHL